MVSPEDEAAPFANVPGSAPVDRVVREGQEKYHFSSAISSIFYRWRLANGAGEAASTLAPRYFCNANRKLRGSTAPVDALIRKAGGTGQPTVVATRPISAHLR